MFQFGNWLPGGRERRMSQQSVRITGSVFIESATWKVGALILDDSVTPTTHTAWVFG